LTFLGSQVAPMEATSRE